MKPPTRFRITHESTFTGLIGIEANWDDERKTLELTQRALINKISEKFQHHISDEKRRLTSLDILHSINHWKISMSKCAESRCSVSILKTYLVNNRGSDNLHPFFVTI